MVTYRDGKYYGLSTDNDWPTTNVPNGAEGIMIDGGRRHFDASTNTWIDWSETPVDDSGNGG